MHEILHDYKVLLLALGNGDYSNVNTQTLSGKSNISVYFSSNRVSVAWNR